MSSKLPCPECPDFLDFGLLFDHEESEYEIVRGIEATLREFGPDIDLFFGKFNEQFRVLLTNGQMMLELFQIPFYFNILSSEVSRYCNNFPSSVRNYWKLIRAEFSWGNWKPVREISLFLKKLFCATEFIGYVPEFCTQTLVIFQALKSA
jgi:hypothetical protein